MDGYRFYAEFNRPIDKRRNAYQGNVVAVLLNNGKPLYSGTGTMDAIGAVYSHADSGVASVGVSPDYLRKLCKRVSEAKAREIHPTLFRVLDAQH